MRIRNERQKRLHYRSLSRTNGKGIISITLFSGKPSTTMRLAKPLASRRFKAVCSIQSNLQLNLSRMGVCKLALTVYEPLCKG